MIQLADLSHWNAEPNWTAMRLHGIVGVWLQVSHDLNGIDPTWPDRSRRARAAGLRVGGYHFADPHASATAQAALFAHQLGPVQRRDLRPFLDLETTAAIAAIPTFCTAFLHTVHSMTGVGGDFYSYRAYIQEARMPATVGYGLLLADYGVNDGQPHHADAPVPWRHVAAHQYTSRGHVGGYGPVDLWQARSLRPLLAHPIRGLV